MNFSSSQCGALRPHRRRSSARASGPETSGTCHTGSAWSAASTRSPALGRADSLSSTAIQVQREYWLRFCQLPGMSSVLKSARVLKSKRFGGKSQPLWIGLCHDQAGQIRCSDGGLHYLRLVLSVTYDIDCSSVKQSMSAFLVQFAKTGNEANRAKKLVSRICYLWII
jgi:hypothetical protein